MKRRFSSLADTHFDLLVAGGGIYGAWTAYDAALRGLKVALVEQGDWAGATSSASTKLIHGGLRYLETYDFRLVRKALKERQRLLRAAPHRVWPLRFGVPVYEDSRIGTLQLAAGLTVYDLLAGGLDAGMRHHHFNAETFAAHFPFLSAGGLHGGFTYADAQTDDARLVLELVSGAMDGGAVCVNYCKLLEVREGDGKACGAVVQDQAGGGTLELRARCIVNTTGRWAAREDEARDWCRLSKGIHLVLPKMDCEEALLLTAPSDGRVFFVIPWYGRTLLGTTDSNYDGDIENLRVEEQEVAYLLEAANHHLKTGWTHDDVIGGYAGLRVMKRSDDDSPSAVSRDWELKSAHNGVLYSIGGKITSAREDAAHIANAVCGRLGIGATCTTGERPFPWAPYGDYAAWLEETHARAAQLGVDAECAMWLARRHGKRANDVLGLVETDARLGGRIVPDLPFMHADLAWCAQHEMAVHLDDLLRRRMPLLILAKLDEQALRRIAENIAPLMGWDEARVTAEVGRAAPGMAGIARPTKSLNHT